MSDVVIVGAKRTAIGSFLGQFTGVPSPTLGAAAIQGALAQSGLAADQIDEVIEPRETRPRLARAFEVLRTKVQQNPPKKHGLSPT